LNLSRQIIFPILLLAFANSLSAQQKTRAPAEFVAWPPLTDADVSAKEPTVEKDAGAEILQWRVHVSDELLGDNRELQRVFYHYIRLKIFSEKGKEQAATIDLPYRSPGGILSVAGRTIKADGTVLELDKKTVYKRDVVRAGGLSEKVVSFAMPGVEPGAILEYRWEQTEDDNRFRYLRLQFQREFPVRKVTYFVKPLERLSGEQMYLMPINSKPSPIHEDADGFSSVTLENVPAARDEVFAPSSLNVEPWALLYYRSGGKSDPDKFWIDVGKKTWKETKDTIKSNGEVKKGAEEAVGAAKTEDEKITALVMWVRGKVRNVFDPETTAAERRSFFAKLPNGRDRNSAEILQSGIATGGEMNVVFLALAEQAGIEARPVLLSSRLMRFEPKTMPDTYFIENRAVAVKRGDSWKVIEVSQKFLDPMMLPWEEEGVFALICDPKDPVFIQTPLPPSESSAELRTAHLKLSADGSLEGDVDETLTGHEAEERREAEWRKAPAQREENLHDRVVRMFPDAEVTNIKLENFTDPTKPLIAHYHLNAPLFAQGIGKRILFQPFVFQRARAALFTATDRRLQIEFPFPWKESDQIYIRLPEGFDLDNADIPPSLDFGKAGAYNIKIGITKGAQPELHVVREFNFGNGGGIMFPVPSYASVKKVFDQIQARDAHTLAVKAQ
jgi:uracil phosphoribosyltransferase